MKSLAVAAYVGAAAVVMLGLFGGPRIPLSRETALVAGYAVVAAGMGLTAWAAWCMGRAVLGTIEPRGRLVDQGPYRWVRHPVYLGFAIALAGVALRGRSWLALAAVVGLFLPAMIWRARLEDQALQRAFGRRWQEYAARTGFLMPRYRR